MNTMKRDRRKERAGVPMDVLSKIRNSLRESRHPSLRYKEEDREGYMHGPRPLVPGEIRSRAQQELDSRRAARQARAEGRKVKLSPGEKGFVPPNKKAMAVVQEEKKPERTVEWSSDPDTFYALFPITCVQGVE